MPEPTYTITITEAERTALGKALGTLTTKLLNAPIFIEAPSGGTQAARAVLSPAEQRRMGQQKDDPRMANSERQEISPPAVAPTPALVELRDRWAHDRKGNEVPMPEGYVAREVNIWKTEQKPGKKNKDQKFLKVTWQSQGQGYVDANCFDSTLFPWIIKQSGQKTTLYLVKSGDYLNVVGVRA